MSDDPNLADLLDEIGEDIATTLDAEPRATISLVIVKHGTVDKAPDGTIELLPDDTGIEPITVRTLRAPADGA